MTSPSATVAPSSTATLTIVPCMGEVTESPEAAAPAFFAVPFGFLAPAAAPPPARPPRPPGTTPSRRPPPTSTATFWPSAGTSASPASPEQGGYQLYTPA